MNEDKLTKLLEHIAGEMGELKGQVCRIDERTLLIRDDVGEVKRGMEAFNGRLRQVEVAQEGINVRLGKWLAMVTVLGTLAGGIGSWLRGKLFSN